MLGNGNGNRQLQRERNLVCGFWDDHKRRPLHGSCYSARIRDRHRQSDINTGLDEIRHGGRDHIESSCSARSH
jgi:hypothetical protein